MKRIFLLLPVTALIALVLHTGCYKDNKEEMYPATTVCDTTNVTYTKDIQTLVNGSCANAGCHDATASGGYNLTTLAGVQTIAQNGRFLAVITAGTMPKNSSKLDDCSINKVSRWINLGTPE